MRIAFIGTLEGTSLHRASALSRLGHSVIPIDPRRWLGTTKWAARWLHRTGGLGTSVQLNGPLFAATQASQPHLIFVNQGEYLGVRLLRRMRTLGVPIVNYSNDNPFSDLHRVRFRRWRK